MADATVDAPAEGKKSSKIPMMIGAMLTVLGGTGGFFVVQMDPLGLFGADKAPAAEGGAASVYQDPTPLGDVGFVEVPLIVIGLGPASGGRTLRFRASLEVPAKHVASVSAIVPRVQDVLNSYLRALEPANFEATGALIRLRSQLLRRVKLVAGDDHVRDLLVLDFIVN